MKTYTEKLHAQYLIRLLENPDACEHCPATVFEQTHGDPHRYDPMSSIWENYEDVCDICIGFVGYDRTSLPMPPAIFAICPCWQLGQREAVKRSWIALEKKGYI